MRLFTEKHTFVITSIFNKTGIAMTQCIQNIDHTLIQAEPFATVEDVWFWFIAAQQARTDGARFVAGLGSSQRPCEPIDILKIMDDLYRKRRLLKEHFLVIRHYGRRFIAPDNRRLKERRAYALWQEAFDRMEPILIRKGIVEPQNWFHNMEAAE